MDRPKFESIEEEIQLILDEFGDVEVGQSHDTSDELSDEQKEQIAAYLEELYAQERSAVDGIAQYIRMSNHKICAIRDEAHRLERRARSMEATQDFLKARWLGIMEAHGKTKVEGETYTLGRRATKVCRIVSEKDVPDEFCVIKTERRPDKRLILGLLKQGDEVPGATLGTTYSLSVR